MEAVCIVSAISRGSEDDILGKTVSNVLRVAPELVMLEVDGNSRGLNIFA